MSANMLEFKADPTVVALAPAAEHIREFATGLVIKNDLSYSAAAALLKSIKGSLATIEDARTRITKPINDSLREVNAQAKAAAAPFLADEQTIKGAMIAYSDSQDRIREEAQRKANEAADAERRRLQEIADRAATKARLEAEEKRREAEKAAAAGRQAEADRLRAQADRVEERAADKVDAFESRASQVVAPVAQQAAPKVAGVSIPMIWDFEVIDEKLIPREYMERSDTRIRKVVQAMQGNTSIPGVRVFQRKRISSTSS